MAIPKKGNQKFVAGVPVSIGDFIYEQDYIRDLRFLQSQVGQLTYDLTNQRMPVRMSGGGLTQGSGTTLNITAGTGWVSFNVTYPNDLSSLPGTVLTGDINVPVSWTQQTNMAIPGATADNVTLNYVKIQYIETDGNTRAYAKKAGTYSYESIPGFTITVNSTAPTQYDLCLGSFTLSVSGTLSFVPSSVAYPIWSNLSYIPVGSSIDFSGSTIPFNWMIEDGSSLLRSSYPALFTAIGTTWGSVDGSHFNLPDSRGLVSVGAGQQGTAVWGGVNYSETFGQYKQDQGQGWQLGAAEDTGGIRDTWAQAEVRYNTSGTVAEDHALLQNAITFQGSSRMFKAMNDGTNGVYRQGKTFNNARITKYKIIKVI